MLLAMEKKYRSRGLSVLGISVGEDRSAVEAYRKNFAVPYHLFLAGPRVYDDRGAFGVPLTLFVDRQGRLAADTIG